VKAGAPNRPSVRTAGECWLAQSSEARRRPPAVCTSVSPTTQGFVQTRGLKYQELLSRSCRSEKTTPGSAHCQAESVIAAQSFRAGTVS
jgi:hypothetical protein